jgi:hypothetical protein
MLDVRRALRAVLITGITFSAFTACSSRTDSATASFTGTLSSLESFSIINPHGFLYGIDRFRHFETMSGSATTVTCSTAENPPTVVSGTISATGAFNVDISSVAGKGMTCVVLDATDEIIGTFLFENSNEKDFGGGTQSIDTIALGGSTSVGAISISGSQITIDAADLGISTTGVAIAAADAFDPSGTWTLGSVPFALPAGYIGPCADGDADCHGPEAGQSIFIKRIAGKAFTPDSTCQSAVDADTYAGGACNGTTSSDDAFALAIWMAEATYLACGNGSTGALGFTENQAKAYAHIDFSSDTSTLHQGFTYGTLGGNVTEGWKDGRATTQWELNSCTNVTIAGQTAWKCLDGSGHYSLSLGGGCTDSSGDPVQPDSWANVNWGASSGCTNSSVTVGGFTLNSNSCTVPYTPSGGSLVNLTCGGTWGAFNVADDSAYNGSVTPTAKLNVGEKCDGSDHAGGAWTPTGDGEELQQLQCYANYFYQTLSNYVRSNPGNCLKEVRTDWSATDPDNFILSDGPGRPTNLALVEKMTYLSANVGAMTQLENEYRGIQVTGQNGSSWVACRTKAKNSITMTKVDATHMVIKFITETHLADSKTACIAAAADEDSTEYSQLGLGTTRMLFYMTKQ